MEYNVQNSDCVNNNNDNNNSWKCFRYTYDFANSLYFYD